MRVGIGTGNRLVNALAGLVKTFGRALAGEEGFVDLVIVRGQQISRFSVCAGNHQRGHAANVSGHTRSDQLLAGLAGREQHLATHVTALLDGGQLVFPMHGAGTGLDHGFHQFKGV